MLLDSLTLCEKHTYSTTAGETMMDTAYSREIRYPTMQDPSASQPLRQLFADELEGGALLPPDRRVGLRAFGRAEGRDDSVHEHPAHGRRHGDDAGVHQEFAQVGADRLCGRGLRGPEVDEQQAGLGRMHGSRRG